MQGAMALEGARGSASAGKARDQGARPPAVVAAMLLAIVAIAALAYWDERRESSTALAEFADEHAAIAVAAGAALAALDLAGKSSEQTLAALRQIERPGAVIV